jgi:hypothetical protein
VEKARKAKIQIKKKKPKPPVKPVKREDKSPERPAKPVVAKESKKEPTPREDPPKSPVRPDPKPEPPKSEPPKHENSDLGTSRCNCPSCQAYEEFISSSLPNFNQGPASGNPGPSSRRRAEGVLQPRSVPGVPSDSVRGSPGPVAQRDAMNSLGGGGDDAREGSTPSDSRRPGQSAALSQSAVSRSSNSGGIHRRASDYHVATR